MPRAHNISTDLFGSRLGIEQADILMRQTDQYAQWQGIRQKNDSEVQRIADLILIREALLQEKTAGKSINWQHFDQLTGQLQQAGLTLPTAKEIQREKNNSTLTAPVAPPLQTPFEADKVRPVSPNSIINEENLLILSLESLAVGLKETIFGYGNQYSTQLPLGEIARSLDFNISVDPNAGTAKGWFISENRTISLDAGKRIIEIDGKSYPWNDARMSVGEDDIYIDSKILSAWLPVDFTVSRGELSVNLTPREKLPLQLQFEREQKRQRLLSQSDLSLKYNPKQSPYELFSFPVMDVSVAGGVGPTNPDLQARYSVVAEGDLAYMGARLFLSGLEDDVLSTARIRLDRFDQEAEMLGLLKASQISLGDIYPVSLPILNNPGEERGVAISNADINRNEDFDTTRFAGDMLPGWDVELYQNGNLYKSVRVGSDGRYVFDDIPVFFGTNSFRILGYGPQGQRRVVEEKEVNIGTDMLPAGNFEYKLSASERKNTVLEVSNNGKNIDDGPRVNGKFGFGLRDNMSLFGGASSVEFDGTRHNYLQAGLSGTLSSFYGQAGIIFDTASGSGLSLKGQTVIGPVRLNAKFEKYFDFVTEDRPNSVLESNTSVMINGRIPEFAYLPSLSYTLSTDYTTYNDKETGRVGAQLSGRFKSLYLSNQTYWNYDGTSSNDTKLVNGIFQASGYAGRTKITGGIKYALGDKNEIREYRLSGSLPINQDLRVGANLVQYDGDDTRTTARAYLDWDAGMVNLSPSLSYDTDGGLGGFLTMSFSLGRNPVSNDFHLSSEKRTGKGSTTAFVYHDANNNQVFDQNDTALPEVEVVARQAGRKSLTNEEGIASITGLTAFAPTDVEIDIETLEDPFWQPVIPGSAIVPRAGNVTSLEFPVVTTGEIDGTIYSLDSNGVREGLSNIQLELIDDEDNVIMTVNSEYDGFYLFEKVFPGTYTLHVTPDDPTIKNQEAGLQKEIIIGNDGTIASGNDIIFQTIAPKDQENDIDPVVFPPSSGSSSGVVRLNEAVASTFPPASDTATTITVNPIEVQSRIRNGVPASGQVEPIVSASSSRPENSLTTNDLVEIPSGKLGTSERDKIFGVHLASYRSLESARVGLGILSKRLAQFVTKSDFTIKQIDLGREKGIWYRVICGQFESQEEATAMTKQIQPRTEYAKSIVVNDETSPNRSPSILAENKNNDRMSRPVVREAETLGSTIPPPAHPRRNGQNSIPQQSSISIDDLLVLPVEEKPIVKSDLASRPVRPVEHIAMNSNANAAIQPISNPIIQPIVPIGRPFDIGFPEKIAKLKSNTPSDSSGSLRQSALALLNKPDEKSMRPSDNVPKNNKLNKHFGVYLASYRTREAARVGVENFSKRLAGIITTDDFSIQKIAVGGERGVLYRVVYGHFIHQGDADSLAERIQSKTEYAKSIVVDDDRLYTESKPPATRSSRSYQELPHAGTIAGIYSAASIAGRNLLDNVAGRGRF